MALPALAAMGIRTLMQKAATRLASSGSKLLTATPSTLSQIGKRVGAAANPQAILAAVKNNKLATAYVLYELYGMGDEVLTAMQQADEDVARTIELFGFQPDEPSSTALADLSSMSEEFDILASAIRITGSFERLLTIKKALTLSDATFMHYRAVRDLGRGLS